LERNTDFSLSRQLLKKGAPSFLISSPFVPLEVDKDQFQSLVLFASFFIPILDNEFRVDPNDRNVLLEWYELSEQTVPSSLITEDPCEERWMAACDSDGRITHLFLFLSL